MKRKAVSAALENPKQVKFSKKDTEEKQLVVIHWLDFLPLDPCPFFVGAVFFCGPRANLLSLLWPSTQAAAELLPWLWRLHAQGPSLSGVPRHV
jgi:hypothetical protein